MSKKKHNHNPTRPSAVAPQPQVESQPNAPKLSFFRALLCKWKWCTLGDWTYKTQNYHSVYCTQEQRCIHCGTVYAVRHLAPHSWGDFTYTGTGCEQQAICKTCHATFTRIQHDWGENRVTPQGNHSYVLVRECKRCHTKEKETGCSHEWEYKRYDGEFHQIRCPHCGESKLEAHSFRYTGTVYDDSYYCDVCNSRI